MAKAPPLLISVSLGNNREVVYLGLMSRCVKDQETGDWEHVLEASGGTVTLIINTTALVLMSRRKLHVTFLTRDNGRVPKSQSPSSHWGLMLVSVKIKFGSIKNIESGPNHLKFGSSQPLLLLLQ